MSEFEFIKFMGLKYNNDPLIWIKKDNKALLYVAKATKNKTRLIGDFSSFSQKQEKQFITRIQNQIDSYATVKNMSLPKNSLIKTDLKELKKDFSENITTLFQSYTFMIENLEAMQRIIGDYTSLTDDESHKLGIQTKSAHYSSSSRLITTTLQQQQSIPFYSGNPLTSSPKPPAALSGFSPSLIEQQQLQLAMMSSLLDQCPEVTLNSPFVKKFTSCPQETLTEYDDTLFYVFKGIRNKSAIWALSTEPENVYTEVNDQDARYITSILDKQIPKETVEDGIKKLSDGNSRLEYKFKLLWSTFGKPEIKYLRKTILSNETENKLSRSIESHLTPEEFQKRNLAPLTDLLIKCFSRETMIQLLTKISEVKENPIDSINLYVKSFAITPEQQEQTIATIFRLRGYLKGIKYTESESAIRNTILVTSTIDFLTNKIVELMKHSKSEKNRETHIHNGSLKRRKEIEEVSPAKYSKT